MTSDQIPAAARSDGGKTMGVTEVADCLDRVAGSTMEDVVGMVAALAFVVDPTAFVRWNEVVRHRTGLGSGPEEAEAEAVVDVGKRVDEALRKASTVVDMLAKDTVDRGRIPSALDGLRIKDLLHALVTARLMAAKVVEPETEERD